jgi:hypothetical protein
MKMIAIGVFALLTSGIGQQLKAQPTQHAIAFAIDPDLPKAIAQKKLDVMFAASLDIEWIENGKDAGFPLSGKAYPCMANYFVQSDTITIALIPGLAMGALLSIQLVKDSAIITHILSPRDYEPSFKLLPTETFAQAISVPAKTVKLLLAAAPMPGKPIEGFVEFESVVFYQKDAAGDIARTYKATGYFKAAKM